ncbi:hypothetical protein GOTRE_060_00050 [Gordonia terrae NBRC 100016]|uniref:Uncharacterized protein n=1 Tax=Gordonia terrae NBRC 100016 TaxID=1089454 RepID=A0ABQ0HE03_9ACTN|nr:hypothetical protein GOTRE_060_00050 [Gordonia terrae NBRC 100016]
MKAPEQGEQVLAQRARDASVGQLDDADVMSATPVGSPPAEGPDDAPILHLGQVVVYLDAADTAALQRIADPMDRRCVEPGDQDDRGSMVGRSGVLRAVRESIVEHDSTPIY